MPPAAIAVERAARHLQLAAAEQELERRRGRELRRVPKPPQRRVELPRASSRSASASSSSCSGSRDGSRSADCAQTRRRAFAPARPTSSRRSRHASATARSTCRNAGSPWRGSGGKYVPPKNGSPSGVRNTVIGQPPLPGQRDDRVHVDRVDVGPLLAVDLDADEELVHQRRRRRVLERLALHHMAPVARRVADREQDRPVLGARPRERLSPHGYQSTGFSACWSRYGLRLLREAVHRRRSRLRRLRLRP